MTADADGLQATWSEVNQLLRSEQYNQAAELLNRIYVASEQAGNQLLASSAAAARQICLACGQLQAIGEWHQQVGNEAGQRQQQLKTYAQTLVSGLGDRALAEPVEHGAAAKREEMPAASWSQRMRKVLSSIKRFFVPQQESPAATPAEPTEERPAIAIEPAEMVTVAFEEEQEPQPAQQIESLQTETVAIEDEQTAQPESPIAAAPVEAQPVPPASEREQESPDLVIYCLGQFRVFQRDQLIGEWNGLKGQAILKYLIAHRSAPVAKDVLIDVFWRDAEPEATRRNLHQAVYSLRQTLRRRDPDVQYILFENNQYRLNPAVSIWLDFEVFQSHVQAGRRFHDADQLERAMVEYASAESLYQGDFFAEDIYDDWPRPQRERIRTLYLDIADRLSDYHLKQAQYSAAIALCQKVLTIDNCVEEAHRRLMRCYVAQGQRHLAIRQYHICVQALAEELQVPPDEQTTALYTSITANI